MTKLTGHARDELTEKQSLLKSSAKSRWKTQVTCETLSRASTRSKASQIRSATRAWKRIQSAAKKYQVELHETGWREIGKKKG